MSDWRRLLKNLIFGTRYVVLIDHDGERTVREIKFSGGKPYVTRHAYGIGGCILADDGKFVSKPCYVDAWEPYDLDAPKRYPTYSRAETP
jgi:hypothetical protein